MRSKPRKAVLEMLKGGTIQSVLGIRHSGVR
jgi:hypothetical protein